MSLLLLLLPDEVLVQIAYRLYHDQKSPSPRASQTAILPLFHASRRLYNIGYPLFYSQVSISNGQQLQDALNAPGMSLVHTIAFKSRGVDGAFPLLSNVLTTSSLGSLKSLRSIIIDGFDLQDANGSVTSLFRNLGPRIKELSLWNSIHAEEVLGTTISTCCVDIEHLSFKFSHSCLVPSSHASSESVLLNLAKNLRSIQFLEFHKVMVVNGSFVDALIKNPSPSLKHFHFKNIGTHFCPLTDQSISQLLQNFSLESLGVLHCWGLTQIALNAIQTYGQTLLQLRISTTKFGVHLSNIVGAVRELPMLELLEIDGLDVAVFDQVDEFLEILKYTPKTLKTMTLSGLNSAGIGAVDYLDKQFKKRFPAVQVNLDFQQST